MRQTNGAATNGGPAVRGPARGVGHVGKGRPVSAQVWSTGGSYFGTQFSTSRGQLILGPKRTEDSLRGPDRLLLALKSRVLIDNFGPGAAIRNLAALIGALRVQSACTDKAWVALAEEYWARVTGSALTFDAGGHFTVATYQVMTIFRQLVDGDMFTQLLASRSGHLQVMGHEGLCVDSGPKQQGPAWQDGVKWNLRTRFPLAYAFAVRGEKGETVWEEWDARRVIHHLRKDTFGARRGLPALAHAINDFCDIIETQGFQKTMIKVAALIGLTRKNDPADGEQPYSGGLAGPMEEEPWHDPATGEVPETTPVVKQTYEQAMEGGLISDVPLEAIHDERPHPNAEAFKKSLYDQAATGLGIAPSLLFFLDEPGGAWTRTLLDLAARTIRAHHEQHLAPMMRRLWFHTIGRGVELGELPEPPDLTWTRVRFTPPRMPTADMGKMGRLMIDLRKACLETDAGYYEELGRDAEDEIDQAARDYKYRMDKEVEYGLPPGALTDGLKMQGAAVQPGADGDKKANQETKPAPEEDDDERE